MPALSVLFVVTAAVGLVSASAVGYAVYLDASARELGWPLALGVGATLLSLPVVPLYLLVRGRLGDRSAPTPTERRVRVVAVGGLLTFTVAAVVPPPDPISQLLAVLLAYPPMLAVGYLLFGR